MERRRKRNEDEETTYWMSYSDMMAALLLIFVLIIAFTMLQSRMQYDQKQKELDEQKETLSSQKVQLEQQQKLVEEQQAVMEKQQKQLDKIVGVRTDLIQTLKTEFENTDLSVKVDSQTGAITFDSSILFEHNKHDVKADGKKFLDEFLPRYFKILMSDEFRPYVSEIIIEGHTDTNGEYLYNLELSQKRALSVASYCLDDETNIFKKRDIDVLREMVTANGRSFSNPVYNSDGSVNMDASRRVEFKFRLQDQEMVEQMIEILNEE